MVQNKSTRWGCDVRLWRGIPTSIPSFHGWKHGETSPVKDSRFYVCHHCNTYVSQEDVPAHPCWDIPQTYQMIQDDMVKEMNYNAHTNDNRDEEFSRHWEAEHEEKEVSIPKYVIATEEMENMGNGVCFLCKDRLTLMYNHDEEYWVYKDSIIARDKLVHQECHDLVSDQDTW